MNKVLIVIDAQEDFTRGALRNEEAIKALPTIHEVVKYADNNFNQPIFYTKDTHFNNYFNTLEGKNLPIKHCIVDTPGHELCTEVLPSSDKLHYLNIRKGTFGYTDWYEFSEINYAEEIWLCGFCTDICVSANFQILKATFPGTPITVIEDACAGATPELHEAALKVMKSCQARVIKWDNLKKENENEVRTNN